MIKFTADKLELFAGKVTIANTSEMEKVITIYVLNKDSVPCVVPAGCSVEITTASAGETFMYLNQAQEGLDVTFAAAAASTAASGGATV